MRQDCSRNSLYETVFPSDETAGRSGSSFAERMKPSHRARCILIEDLRERTLRPHLGTLQTGLSKIKIVRTFVFTPLHTSPLDIRLFFPQSEIQNRISWSAAPASEWE